MSELNCPHCEKLEDAFGILLLKRKNAIRKLLFESSVERLNCITEHEDFVSPRTEAETSSK